MVLEKPYYIEIIDYGVGIVYILAFVIGFLGNILAITYFRSKTKELPTLLYLITACNDVLLCSLNLCSGLSLMNHRQGTLFSNHIFCTIWDILHFVSAKFSVILVLILCMSRTFALMYPFKLGVFTKNKVLFSLALFFVLLIVVDHTQRFLGYGVSSYVEHDAYCWMTASNDGEVSTSDSLLYFYLIAAALLSLPIIPVSVACVITVVKVQQSLSRIRSNNTGNSIKKHATVTIILFTSAYIIFNIPLFVNYVAWVTSICIDMRLYTALYERNTFMYFYAWNVTDVLCVSLNAMINPIVYYWRIGGFRKWTARAIYCFCGRHVEVRVSVDSSGFVHPAHAKNRARSKTAL